MTDDDLKALTEDELRQVPAGLKACYHRACEAAAQCTSTLGANSSEAELAYRLRGRLILACRAHIVQERTRIVEKAVSK